MRWKLATLTVLEWIAGLARRLRLGFLVDRLAPRIGRPFEHFVLDIDGVSLGGTSLSQLHYARELLEQGREQTFVRLLSEAVPRGGTVLEGGAHLGFVTVHAARAVGPDGRVIAFEPNGDVHPSLCENLAANGVAERVELIPKALGDSAGRARFFVRDDTSSLVDLASDAVPVEVEVVRADEEIAGPIDVVKLDIEGGESAALRGMAGLLSGSRPPAAIFAECYPQLLEAAGSSSEELISVLEGHGYRVEWIDEAAGRAIPLSEPWTGDYVNLVCRRES
ncbi:MAG TPA: FkbM family methyltransferase [Gaiellaceae bacterium]